MVSNQAIGSIKESVMKYLAEQPDDISLEEIQDFLFVKQQVLKGQEALRDGHYYTHEEAREIMKKWLK